MSQGVTLERAEELIDESKQLRHKFYFQGSMVRPGAQPVYDYYLKFGHTKNQQEHDQIQTYFRENMLRKKMNLKSFMPTSATCGSTISLKILLSVTNTQENGVGFMKPMIHLME